MLRRRLGALKATAQAVRQQMTALEAPLVLMRTNQPAGFDCPGCAWPDKEHRSTFQFCENGAKAVTWEATNKRVTPEFFERHTVTELLELSDYELENFGRLTHPMAYDAASDKFRPVSWEAAFARIGQVLRGLTRRTRRSSTRPGARPTKRPTCFSCTPASTAPTIFPTVRTCATKLPAWTAAVHRHRQGHRVAGRFRADRAHHLDGSQPRHQPSAHDGHPARGGAPRRADHRLQPRCASARWNASPIRRTS